MKRIILNTLYFLLFAVLIGCSNTRKGDVFEYKKEIVVAKTVETMNATALNNGYTTYKLAFESGYYDSVGFGIYSISEIGDTLNYERKNGWFWELSK